MGTVMYECGCSFSHSMFGDRRMMALNLCSHHIGHPKVQKTAVKDLQVVIKQLLEDEPFVVEKVKVGPRGSWSIPSDEEHGAGCLL